MQSARAINFRREVNKLSFNNFNSGRRRHLMSPHPTLFISPTRITASEPNNEWTIEELIQWSLAQYQTKTTDEANEYIEQLRDHCTKECEDVMDLHTMALEATQNNENAAAVESSAASEKSPNTATRKDYIEILITSGPHSSERQVLLKPKPNKPCFIGRSKGRKFVNNGLSLNKDQEVSTTHAQILVEGGGLADANGITEMKFYFMDVGSTNGSFLEGEMIEPEPNKVLIKEGMEIKVGGSLLKFILG